MEAVELKARFHDLINHFEDQDILEDFYQALDHYHKRNGGDILDDLTEAQQYRLNMSIRQSEHDRCIPHEMMKAEIKKWLT